MDAFAPQLTQRGMRVVTPALAEPVTF